MPAQPPVAYATLSNCLPDRQYILSITPSGTSGHLLLRHPTSEITIADAQSLQAIDSLKGGHDGQVMNVCVDRSIWTGGKDAKVVGWDERSRRLATTIKGMPGLELCNRQVDEV